jgi:hypothetical protein
VGKLVLGHSDGRLVGGHFGLLLAGLAKEQPARELRVPVNRFQSFTEMFIFRTSLSGSGRSRSIDKSPFFKLGSLDEHSVGKHEHPLELPCGDATMQKLALGVVFLAPTHDELVFLGGNVEICSLNPATANVMRRRSLWPSAAPIARYYRADSCRRSWPSAFERLLHGVEAKQQGARKWRHSAHVTLSSSERPLEKNPDGIFPSAIDMVRPAAEFKRFDPKAFRVPLRN